LGCWGWGASPTMEKEERLTNKVKHLLRRIGAPKRLHHFGPKTYKLWQHIFALFVKANCGLSYRRTTAFLRGLGFKVAAKSTLQRYAAKLRLPFWQRMFSLTFSNVTDIVSMDGTGLEKTKTSQHYIKRIDGRKPYEKGFQFGIIVGEDSKILSLRLRKRYSHDIRNAKYLARRLPSKPKVMLMDKGYDSEKLHRYFAEQNIWSIAPVKKNWRKGQLRKKLKTDFPQNLYNKRSRVESIFHAFKQKFGASVSSKKIGAARTEVYCKAILYNIALRVIQLLGQTLKSGGYIKKRRK
jgi:transposase